MGDPIAFGMTAGQISLALSVIAAYGIALIYIYQTGFFAAVGFEFAGMTSPLEIWSNAGRLAMYVSGACAAIILIMFAFQAAKQSNVDLPGWLIRNETIIFLTLLGLTSLSALLTFTNHRSDLDHYFMIINLLVLLIYTYAHSETDAKYSLWQILMACLYPPMLSAGLGLSHGFTARIRTARRYDIFFDEKRSMRVRLIRASSGGILYAPDGGGATGFINASKIERITPVKL